MSTVFSLVEIYIEDGENCLILFLYLGECLLDWESGIDHDKQLDGNPRFL